jgi:hypothetical protein
MDVKRPRKRKAMLLLWMNNFSIVSGRNGPMNVKNFKLFIALYSILSR